MKKNLVYTLIQEMKNLGFAKQKPQIPTAIPSAKPLLSLDKIKLYQWIDTVVDAKFELLGDATEEELIAHYSQLQTEFSEISGGSEALAANNKIKQVLRIENRIAYAKMYMEVLNVRYSEVVWKLCYKLGYDLPMITANENNIEMLVQRLVGAIKKDMLNLENLKHELKANEGKVTIDKKYYYQLIAEIETTLKMTINEEIVSAYKFAILISKYNTQCEIIKQQIEKNKK